MTELSKAPECSINKLNKKIAKIESRIQTSSKFGPKLDGLKAVRSQPNTSSINTKYHSGHYNYNEKGKTTHSTTVDAFS
ncbi:14819_t:CDS:2 [Gigaspora rosea]|nr:14819_t:CDS:2 [Gigaspora rosea]